MQFIHYYCQLALSLTLIEDKKCWHWWVGGADVLLCPNQSKNTVSYLCAQNGLTKTCESKCIDLNMHYFKDNAAYTVNMSFLGASKAIEHSKEYLLNVSLI